MTHNGVGLTVTRAAWIAATAALVAHAGCLFARLVYDDQVLLGSVPFLSDWRSLFRMWSPEWYWNSGELSWRPLTVALHVVERRLLGDSLPALHAVSWLVHGAAAWLCVRWLAAMALPPVAALAGGLVLAVHPVGVEAVIMITFVEDPLVTALLLAGAWIAARGPRGSGQAVGLAALAFAAMGAKESGLLALPLWALAAVGGARGRGERPAWRPWLPAIAAVGSATVLYALLRFGVFVNPTASVPRLRDSLGPLLAADCWILGQYAVVLLVPLRLCIDWTVPHPLPWHGLLLGVLALGAAAGLAWRFRRDARGVPLGIAWAALALAPVMNLVPLSIPAAERFLYLPLAGLGWAVAAGVARLSIAPVEVRRAVLGVAAILPTLWTLRDWMRAPDFRNRIALWTATAAANPESPRAAMMLAGAVIELEGADPAQRRAALERAARIYREEVLAKWPADQNVRLHLAVALMQLAQADREAGRDDGPRLAEADRLLREHCERWPNDHRGWLNLAQLAHVSGQLALERQMLERAIAAEPVASPPYASLAFRLGTQGRYADGLAALDRAPPQARATPIWAAERVKLLATLGRVDEARAVLADALDRWPDHAVLRPIAAELDRGGR